MKLAVFNGGRLGIVRGGSIYDITDTLPAFDTGLLANHWVRLCAQLPASAAEISQRAEAVDPIPLGDVELEPAALNPSKIVAAGGNYHAHVREMRPEGTDFSKLDTRAFFDVFLKAPSSIVGPDCAVPLPKVDTEIHHEGELAFVIGKKARFVSERSAMEHVAGFTAAVDVTVRGKGDRSRRKSHDGFTPIGPWMVTADEVPDWETMGIELQVNGEVRQSIRAGEMIRGIPEIIAQASRVMTLMPGDVVITGSPPGVGEVKPGDVVDLHISQIGSMRISFEQEPELVRT